MTPDELYNEHGVFMIPTFQDDFENPHVWNIYLSREDGEYILGIEGEFMGLAHMRKNKFGPPMEFSSWKKAYEYINSQEEILVFPLQEKTKWIDTEENFSTKKFSQ